MGRTQRGLEVSTDARDAIDAVDTFTDRLAGIELGVEAVLDDAAHHAGVAMLQLDAAMLGLYGQTAAASADAHRYLAKCEALEPTMNERERATLAALQRWHAHDFLAAAGRFEELVTQWPRDIVALKALEFLYYVLGQQHMGKRFRAQVERIAAPNRDDADFLSVWAFAAELSGAPDHAADLAEASLGLDAHPWAHHALSHVFITRGDPPEAIARLQSFLPVWETSGRVIYCHNAWHLAVAFLDALEVDRAESVYRHHIWGVYPDSPGEQVDAISYLWRLEMAGVEVDNARWADVADHVEARAGECFFPFLSAQHGYALARAGRPAALDTLRSSVRRRTEADDGEARRVWQPVGRAVVEACIAHGAGDPARAATLLDPVMSRMTAIGGSDAQDDLFRQAYLTALIAAARPDDARRYWASMTSFKTRLSALDDRFRSRISGA
jgi:hypothetical protein